MRRDSSGWQLVFKAEGLAVYCTGTSASPTRVQGLHAGGGVILGAIFRRGSDGTSSDATFGRHETDDILATSGRALVERYWGRYVAFLISPDGSSYAMRSPTGELDCLTTIIRGVRIYFSATEHCPLLDLETFSINWDYIAADLATLLPDTRECGLTQIKRVMHGECVQHREGHAESRAYWHPFNFVRRDPIDDPAAAVEELSHTVRDCVNAYTSRYANIMAMLSGGLDSSIIVGLLRQSPSNPAVTCVNYRNLYDPISDEREYARVVAGRTGYALIEREHANDFSLQTVLNMPRTASPCQMVYGLGDTQPHAELTRSVGAQAQFYGHGGDEVFFKNAGQYQCADYLYRYGLSAAIFPIALSAARMTHRSLWPALKSGFRDGFQKSGLKSILQMRNAGMFELIRDNVLEGVRDGRLFVPHWFDGGDAIPPGKCEQIIGLSAALPMYSPYAPEDQAELVSPLLAQPIQELSFRIPTHVLSYGGRSRGLARRAFHSILPPEVAYRQVKGGALDFMKELWLANTKFVREYLLDGELVSRGIVDRSKLERTVTGDLDGDFTSSARLVCLFCEESWIRNWSSTTRRAAA